MSWTTCKAHSRNRTREKERHAFRSFVHHYSGREGAWIGHWWTLMIIDVMIDWCANYATMPLFCLSMLIHVAWEMKGASLGRFSTLETSRNRYAGGRSWFWPRICSGIWWNIECWHTSRYLNVKLSCIELFKIVSLGSEQEADDPQDEDYSAWLRLLSVLMNHDSSWFACLLWLWLWDWTSKPIFVCSLSLLDLSKRGSKCSVDVFHCFPRWWFCQRGWPERRASITFGCLRVSDFHKVLDSVYSPFVSIMHHYIFCVNAVWYEPKVLICFATARTFETGDRSWDISRWPQLLAKAYIKLQTGQRSSSFLCLVLRSWGNYQHGDSRWGLPTMREINPTDGTRHRQCVFLMFTYRLIDLYIHISYLYLLSL